jgi:multidrug resistance efflux pump
MDRLTALVAIAHLKLRLEMIQRHPQVLEDTDMIDIKRPIELAGMRSRLQRAKKLETDIAVTGQRYDQVLDAIDEQHASLKGHVGALENEKSQLDQVLGAMIAGGNGAPNDGEASLSGSASDAGAEVGQVIEGKPIA